MVLDPRAGNGFLLGLKTGGLAGLQLGHRVTGLTFQVGISCLREMAGETLSWLLSSWRMAKGRESLELLSWGWCLKNNDINTAQKSACGLPDGDQTRNTVLTYPSAHALPSSITSETKQLPQMAPWNINHKGPSFQETCPQVQPSCFFLLGAQNKGSWQVRFAVDRSRQWL